MKLLSKSILKKANLISAIILIFTSFTLSSQNLELMTDINSTFKESSGVIYLNGQLITHVDSGGPANLYVLDSISGNITRTVAINGATNIDWEDISIDNTHMYIGDFGNNAGARTDLKIYKVKISDFENSSNSSIPSEVISFSYDDQIDFTPTSKSTNFDAEAMISYNDSLYIFTKNWGNSKSNIYSLSKIPGTYSSKKIDSFDSQGLVTGATLNTNTNTIGIVGYTKDSYDPFAIEILNFSPNKFSTGTIIRYPLSLALDYSKQIESIGFGNNHYFVTSEQSSASIFTFKQALFRFTTPACAQPQTPSSSNSIMGKPMLLSEIPNHSTSEKVLVVDDENKITFKTFSDLKNIIKSVGSGVSSQSNSVITDQTRLSKSLRINSIFYNTNPTVNGVLVVNTSSTDAMTLSYVETSDLALLSSGGSITSKIDLNSANTILGKGFNIKEIPHLSNPNYVLVIGDNNVISKREISDLILYINN